MANTIVPPPSTGSSGIGSPFSDEVELTVSSPPTRATRSLLGATGIGFATTFVVGMVMMSFTWNDEADIISWYNDSGNRWRQIGGLYIVALSGLALMGFLTALRSRLRAAGEDLHAALMTASGAIFVACLYAGGAAITAVSAHAEFGELGVPDDPLMLAVIESMGYAAILGFGGFAAALCIFSATRGAHRADLFPRWLMFLGYVASLLLLASTIFVPIVLLPVWVLAVGIWALMTKQDRRHRL